MTTLVSYLEVKFTNFDISSPDGEFNGVADLKQTLYLMLVAV